MEHVEGFDADQKERLQSRKRVKGSAEAASETDKWRDVYRILFPHVESDDIPSPCKFAMATYNLFVVFLTQCSL